MTKNGFDFIKLIRFYKNSTYTSERENVFLFNLNNHYHIQTVRLFPQIYWINIYWIIYLRIKHYSKKHEWKKIKLSLNFVTCLPNFIFNILYYNIKLVLFLKKCETINGVLLHSL